MVGRLGVGLWVMARVRVEGGDGTANFAFIGEVIGENGLPAFGVFCIESANECVDWLQIFWLADLIVVLFNIDEFLLACVLFVEQFGVGVMDEVVALGSDEDSRHLDVLHLLD